MIKKIPYIFALAVFLIATLLSSYSAIASDKHRIQLPIPRFVSLGADEVNVRIGPGIRYPIKFILKKEELPVEVIKEFDVWRQIRNIDGDEGWVHKSLLSGKRRVIVKGHIQTIYKEPSSDTKPIVKFEPGVIAKLNYCKAKWCYIKAASYKGWIKRKNIWGVYADEVIRK